MSLLALWKNSKEELQEKNLQQLLPLAGNGKLKDGNTASKEIREFFAHMNSDFLKKYMDDCLTEKFQDSGLALQDIVNEMGKRLGLIVDYGKYRKGVDGIWKYKDGNSLIIEVKTSDVYLTEIDPVIKNQKKLIKNNEIDKENSYILYVVGRINTSGFEAQVRGSRYAWDIRIISAESLYRLLKLKESVDDPGIIKQIHEILIPQEFTKLDNIIDIMFSTAEEVKDEMMQEEKNDEKDRREKSKRAVPVSFHEKCQLQVEKHLDVSFIKKTKTKYSSDESKTGIVVVISKVFEPETRENYWFAFHPHQKEFLEEHQNGFIVLGCGSEKQILLIPKDQLFKWLDGCWKTKEEKRYYWHITVFKEMDKFVLHRSKGNENIDVSKFLI
jgi:hypothetical protein